jgi:hypothetical protein
MATWQAHKHPEGLQASKDAGEYMVSVRYSSISTRKLVFGFTYPVEAAPGEVAVGVLSSSIARRPVARPAILLPQPVISAAVQLLAQAWRPGIGIMSVATVNLARSETGGLHGGRD